MRDANGTTIKTIKRQSRGRCPDGAPNPIDVYVGHRLKARRLLLGMSMDKLASLMGLTFQQIQKYERGSNRIGASRMWDFSKILGVDVNFFFEDMSQDIADQSPRNFVYYPDIIDNSDNNPLPTPIDRTNEAQELVRNYFNIQNRAAARSIFLLLKSLATSSPKINIPPQE